MSRHGPHRQLFTVFLMAVAVLLSATAKSFAQVTLASTITAVGGSSVSVPEAAYVDVYGNIYVLTATGATAIEIPANGGPVIGERLHQPS